MKQRKHHVVMLWLSRQLYDKRRSLLLGLVGALFIRGSAGIIGMSIAAATSQVNIQRGNAARRQCCEEAMLRGGNAARRQCCDM